MKKYSINAIDGVQEDKIKKKREEVLIPNLGKRIMFEHQDKFNQQKGHNQIQGHLFLPFKNTHRLLSFLFGELAKMIDKNYSYNPLFLLFLMEA